MFDLSGLRPLNGLAGKAAHCSERNVVVEFNRFFLGAHRL